MSRVVLSTSPNTSQLDLGDASKAILKYMPETDVQSVKISVSRTWHTPELTCAIWVYERNGRFHQATIPLVEFDRPVHPHAAGQNVEWSAASLELSRHYRSSNRRASAFDLSISPELREVLSRPTKVDPISFGFGEGMLAVAKERGIDLVGTAADDDIKDSLAFATPGCSTEEFLAIVGGTTMITVTEDKAWMVVRPSDPIAAREMRGDRAALEKLIDKAKGRVLVGLDDLAEFACSNLKCQALPLAFSLPFRTMVNHYGASGDDKDFGDLRPLQFYGTLGASQRQRLRIGQELAVTQMPLRTKEVLRSIFFQPERVIPGSLSVEPTSVMPDGDMPAGLRIVTAVENATILCPLPDVGEVTIPSRGLIARQLATDKWLRLNYPNSAPSREPNRMLIGSRTLWQFRVVNGQYVYATLLVADDRVPSGAEPTFMNELPEGVKRELDKAYEDLYGGGR